MKNCRWLSARRSLMSLVTNQSWQWSLTIRWSSWKYKCDISFDHVTYYWHPVHYHHHSPLTSTILLSTSSASIILLCSICFLFRSILWHWPRAQVNRSTAKPDWQNGPQGKSAVYLSLMFECNWLKRSKSKSQRGSPCHWSEVFPRGNKIIRLGADL